MGMYGHLHWRICVAPCEVDQGSTMYAIVARYHQKWYVGIVQRESGVMRLVRVALGALRRNDSSERPAHEEWGKVPAVADLPAA